ncbi:hypothetical protein C8N46_109133 [Kordia periserrulae]|uniref:Uncharacterized protein n=1 Tax=Kordia periserrulae TaxID=701523 RepID=A0A2T6BU16_9FLAO|nr:hypothetical protein [Kordia periserrulae]PTX59544.1 hypothetical protein C8N46_109133 [Kordia periserrulae]
MKKRNLKSISIKKTPISDLRQTEIKGGPEVKTGNILVGGVVAHKCKKVN